MKCAACGGPYSPETGHVHTPRVVLCGTCARDFLAWLIKHTARRWGKLRFYDFTIAPKYGEEVQ